MTQELNSTGAVGEDVGKLGVVTFDDLIKGGEDEQYEIDGLFLPKSVNILVGHSGLGKTPLGVQAAVAQASGKEFLGRKVTKAGRVLFCDGESGKLGLKRTARAIGRYMKIDGPLEELFFWCPFWNTSETKRLPMDIDKQMFEKVAEVKPKLVVIDSLRVFFTLAVEKQVNAMPMITSMRHLSNQLGCYWLIVHHLRKSDRAAPKKVSLEDGHSWFEEAAGSHALINATDCRLGVEACKFGSAGDLTLAGFQRLLGWVGPFTLKRIHDEEGDGAPLGYDIATGLDHLNPKYREVYEQLAASFRFKDVREGGLGSESTSRFLSQCQALGLLERNGNGYEKLPEVGKAGLGGPSEQAL